MSGTAALNQAGRSRPLPDRGRGGAAVLRDTNFTNAAADIAIHLTTRSARRRREALISIKRVRRMTTPIGFGRRQVIMLYPFRRQAARVVFSVISICGPLLFETSGTKRVS